MELALADLLAWLAPRALLLAVVVPFAVRVVGHLVPEELFMIAIGVLAARSDSPADAALLIAAVLLSHAASDNLLFLGGRWLGPRLGRFPWVARRLAQVSDRLRCSPGALLGLIPARVLPLGRGAWLLSCGVVGIAWRRFLLVDVAALLTHLVVWSGLGWWLAGDLGRLVLSAELARVVGFWLIATLIAAGVGVWLWRRRPELEPVSARAMRRATRGLRVFVEGRRSLWPPDLD